MMMAFVSLCGGCVANVPVRTDRPSQSFETDYIKTHLQSTKRVVIEELGPPEAIFQSNNDTYYVYKATGDLRRMAGIVVSVPPYFVPIFTGKEKNVALHCLALTFDEKGLLKDYRTTIGTEEVLGGVFLGFGPPAEFSLGKEDTECVATLWNEEELQLLDPIKQEKEIRSLETATPGDRLSVWAYRVFGNTMDGYDWLCRAADQGGTQSRARLGDLFYNESHRSSENLIHAYVWYSLANKANNSAFEKRLMILNEVLSYGELQEAHRRIDSWKPNECMKTLEEGGLLRNGNSEEDLNYEIDINRRINNMEPFPERNLTQLRDRAEQGDKKAMLQLFWSINGPERLRWLCRAAGQGSADAEYRVGTVYRYGMIGFVPQDIVRAYLWYRLAAKNGHISANSEADELARQMTSVQLNSAEMLMTEWEPEHCEAHLLLYCSFDTQSDLDERTRRYEESDLQAASEMGDAQSQWQAYRMLGNTSGGYKWLCRAADQGYLDAQILLGYLYRSGAYGFTQDFSKSYVWYRLAGEGGHREAVETYRKKLEKNRFACSKGQACLIAKEIVQLQNILQPEGVSKAELLLKQWQPGQCERQLVPTKSGD